MTPGTVFRLDLTQAAPPSGLFGARCGARFFLEAELLRYYGEPIRDFVEKRLTLVTTGFLAVLVGGFFIAKYAF